ncbi:unnamed protein product [Rhizophagus irregularis]|uniref:Uncharacterized protein n=1 Tax=Rhizophagus irregularis TaxID=588596 RepID=A0A916EDG7_9GLOM|nr:unnamed protein product [Rhizophagus irregularis]
MIHDPPKFSLAVELNKSPPSILVCSIHNGPTLVTAKYYTNFNNYINKAELPDDLVGDFNDLIGNNGFGQDENASGISSIVGDSDRGAFVFIGDTNNEMDWTQPMFQGNKFSNIGFLFFNGVGGLFQYAETHHKALNGSSYRNFQLSSVGTFGFIDYSRPAAAYDVGIIAPENIVAQVENPSLTIADLLTNIGGYLGIWGIFGFLFGEKKVDPFGFVSRFIFIKQDRKKLFEELEKINGERSTKLNISKEEEKGSDSVTKTSKISNQTEFKNLHAKYNVETDCYEHAVETPEV